MGRYIDDDPDEPFRQAEQQFFNSLTSKKGKQVPTKMTKPTAIDAVIETKPKPSTITFAEVARLLGIAENELTEWASRGLLPSPDEPATHPGHWRWNRDTMTRWCNAMTAELTKAQKSRL